jgi:hypothetical protein
VHNEVLRLDPQAARAAAASGVWFYDRRGEVPKGEEERERERKREKEQIHSPTRQKTISSF